MAYLWQRNQHKAGLCFPENRKNQSIPFTYQHFVPLKNLKIILPYTYIDIF